MYYEPEKIEAISFRRNKKPGQLKAYAEVRIGRIEIKNFTIVEIDDGTLKVYSPTLSWENPQTHEKRYFYIVTLPKDVKERVERTVLAAWAKENHNERKN